MSQLTLPLRRAIPGLIGTVSMVTIRRAAVALPLLVVMILVLDYVVALTREGTRSQVWLWTTLTMAFPVWFIGAATLIAVLLTLVLAAGGAVKPLGIEIALVVEMGAYFFLTKVWPQTGDQVGWMENAATPNLAASELLSDFAHKVAYWMSGSLDGVRYTAPVFGVFTVIVYLILARRLAQRFGAPRWVFQGFLVASPLPFWYVTSYTENTFLAIPFLLLGIHFLIGHTGPVASRLRTLVPASAGFALAGLFHAGFALMCAALAAYLLVRPGVGARRRLTDLAIALVAVMLVVALAFGLLRFAPVTLVPGNSGGGYDGSLLTPVSIGPVDTMARFTMFSHAHLIEVSNIVVHGAPALVLALPVVLLLAFRRRQLAPLIDGRSAWSSSILVLALTASVYLLFVAVWGFDLGPVGDLDLMLTMGCGLGLFVLATMTVLLRDRLAIVAALLVASGAINMAFYSMKVANVWAQ